jgi:predicted nucleotidyltransferase
MSDIIHSVSEPASGLLPIFRSDSQLRLLAYIFIHADRPHTPAELSRATGIAQPTVSREAARLVKAGILIASHRGRAKLIQPNRQAPYFADLSSLLVKVAGPPRILADLLDPIGGVEAAYIYGSWARRYFGEQGEYPRDVDLLVIGEPSIDAIYGVAAQAESQLGLEVNPTIVSPEEWERPQSVFLQTVKADRLVPVIEP